MCSTAAFGKKNLPPSVARDCPEAARHGRPVGLASFTWQRNLARRDFLFQSATALSPTRVSQMAKCWNTSSDRRWQI
eukprot:7542672-Pyramimonas_sp.AAC.1